MGSTTVERPARMTKLWSGAAIPSIAEESQKVGILVCRGNVHDPCVSQGGSDIF